VDGLNAQMLVSGGAAAIGIAALLWAVRVTDGARGAVKRFRVRAAELEDKLARADSLFGAHPGVVLVWEETGGAIEERDWGQPRLYGSPLALASLLRFSDAASASDPAIRIVQGLAAFDATDLSGAIVKLAPLIARLRRDGAPFSVTVSTPNGVFVEVDGRTAGPRAVVWIMDASVKGVEEGVARGRLEEARQVIARDPAAFLEMMSRAPFLAWRLSAAGKLEWANKVYLEALESKNLDQALARNLLLDQSVADRSRQAIEDGASIDEIRHVVLGGRRRAMRVVLFPIAGGAGGMAFDVTEAEQSRDTLAKMVKAHDQTLNHLAEGVAIFGADKRLIFHNRAFQQMWELDPAFLIERPTHAAWLDLLKEKRRLPAHANYAEWRANELALYQEVAELPEAMWVLPEGRTLRVARQRHPMGGLLLIFSDITNELSLKSQYTTLLQTQKAALDRLHEGVAVFGLDGRLRLSNAAFAQMWRLEPEQLAGDVVFDGVVEACTPLFHDAGEWRKVRRRITDPSPEARQEGRGEMPRADGSTLTYLTRPLPDGATLIAFLDVTASQQVEAALRDRADALETADRLKTEFVQNVSYQLRTPLQTIQGYSEILQAKLHGPLNGRQEEQVELILSAADALSKLVDNILDIAMLDAGRLELDVGALDLAEVLAETAALVEAKARTLGVTVRLDVAPGLGPVHADDKRIRQILFNLVSNALRFTDREDVITLGAARGEGEVRLWVADTGRGIPLETQAGVFGNFISGDKRGAGLGLALARSLVELHGGWIALESTPGKGTTISCHLPTVAASAAA
jgi:signal transduction histidine kinase